MQWRYTFTIDAPIDEVWRALTALRLESQGFPGTALAVYEDGRRAGPVKIKVGPIPVLYTERRSHVAYDAGTREVVVTNTYAAAIDTDDHGEGGRGNATATMTGQMTADRRDRTLVSILMDLTTTDPARFDPSGMDDLAADHVIAQFTASLVGRLAALAAVTSTGPEATVPNSAGDRRVDARHHSPAVPEVTSLDAAPASEIIGLVGPLLRTGGSTVRRAGAGLIALRALAVRHNWNPSTFEPWGRIRSRRIDMGSVVRRGRLGRRYAHVDFRRRRRRHRSP